MDPIFKDTVALVTGAAGAIGKGIAADFCRCGAKVFITDLDQAGVDAAVREITASGGSCAGLAADVTSARQVAAVVDAAKGFGGRIDFLVNVAGVVGQGKVEDLTEEEWD